MGLAGGVNLALFEGLQCTGLSLLPLLLPVQPFLLRQLPFSDRPASGD